MNDVTVRRPLTWVSAGATDVGTVRPLNEDAFLTQPELCLWTVADGMGGHDGGSVASNLIVDELKNLMQRPHLDDAINDIEDTILSVNQRLREYSRINLNGRIIGSTFVSLLIKGNVGVCLWAGDSRLYRLRHNQLQHLNFDHSHVAEMVRQGLISEEQAETHPESNVITRAVGTSERLDIDIELFDVNVGDQFMLCSDGLYNSVPMQQLIEGINQEQVDIAVDQLIHKALTNNASDNVSVVVVKGIHQNVPQ